MDNNNNRNNPREGGAPGQSAPGPADPQAADSTACTGRASDYEAGPGPLLCDGRRGFRACRGRRDELALERLAPAERQYVWRGIKALEPKLAALLRDDPGLAALRERFGAYTRMRQADYRRFLKAGKEATHGTR